MIIFECEQHSEEWYEARRGIPTASEFSNIFTSTGKRSESATTYRRKLLGEWLVGQESDDWQSKWMQRGSEVENEARQYYEFHTGNEVQQVGLIFKDDHRLVSCSPDGLVNSAGGLEIKCPAPGTHIKYLLDNKLPTTYLPQVQGSLWITDREWWDFVSYHPDIEPLIIRVNRDEQWIAKFEPIIEAFIDKLLAEREQLIQRGIMP